jgi:hypothetical protein
MICPKKVPLFIGGDFNARLGEFGAINKTIGKFLLKDEFCKKDNGSLLTDFLMENKLCVPKSFFKSKYNNSNRSWRSCGKTSFYFDLNGNKKRSFCYAQLDHLLCNKWFKQHVINSKYVSNFDDISDHRMLVTTIKLKKPFYSFKKKL